MQAGFLADDIVVVDGIVYVGRDAEVSLEASREMLQVGDSSKEQYRTTNTVSHSLTKLCINGSTLEGAFSTALDLAIQNYDELPLTFAMARTPSSGCSVTINAVIQPGVVHGSSGFPAGGKPFRTINLGEELSMFSVDTIEHAITHQIGHTIGLRHTDFFDPSISCGTGSNEGDAGIGAILIPGTPGGATVGGSIMNSCFRASETGELSASDITALQALYSAFRTADVFAGYKIDDVDNWKVADDLNGDGRPDLVDTFFRPRNGEPGVTAGIRVHTLLSGTEPGAWTFVIDDPLPGYELDDTANWKVIGDLNGDGRPDLVDTYFRPRSGEPGVTTGLRVHTLLSTAVPGTWRFEFDDSLPAYGIDDMANWKVTGDLNGDGRPDLVDTFFRPRNREPGITSGLRVHTLLSTAVPGKWTFVFDDPMPAYGIDDMANWKVTGDLNGDGRADLVDTYFRPRNGEPGITSGLRVHTLLSSAQPGRWTFWFADPSPGYPINDMENWKVTGDLNGDGRPDLVDTFFRPRNCEPGVTTGLRVHMLLSTEQPDNWTFDQVDPAPDYRVDDMANWKVAGDLDGDGRPDLIDTFFRPRAGEPGVTTGLRVNIVFM